MSTTSSSAKMSLSSSLKSPLSPAADDTDLRAMGSQHITVATASPPGQMLEKYFTMSPTEVDHPRFNLLNKARPRSSSLLNINDPVAMHLLVETAIIDSNDYEVLSFEEVEELKKEYQFLSSRIDASRRKLALESKVRDAALSLSRLNRKGRRKSILAGHNDISNKTEDELMQSNQKCEKLLEELWKLSVRAWEIQRRLLQHGAGILGMTHQGGRRPIPSQNSNETGSSPSSSTNKSSIAPYVYGNPRMSILRKDEFDDKSFYRLCDIGSLGMDPLLESKLVELNDHIRAVLSGLGKSPPSTAMKGGKASGIQEQINMLQQGIRILVQEASSTKGGSVDSKETTSQLAKLWDMVSADEEPKAHDNASDSEIEEFDYKFSLPAFSAKVEALYRKSVNLRNEVMRLNEILSNEIDAVGKGREEQLVLEINRLEAQIEEMESELEQKDIELATANTEINTLQEELKERGLDMSDQQDEIENLKEELENLKNRSAPEDVLESEKKARQAIEDRLKEKEEELKAKIVVEENLLGILRQKETELIQRVEAQEALVAQVRHKESQLSARGEEEFMLEARLRERENELADLESRFEEMKDDRNILKAELDAAKAELETFMADAAARAKQLEEEVEKAKSDSESEAAKFHSELEEKVQSLEKMDIEMRELVEKVANISTELAIKTAELDQAYGSRQQRAAETAEQIRVAQLLEQANKSLPPDPTALREIDDLRDQNQALLLEIENVKSAQESAAKIITASLEKRNGLLQQELNGMLQDFEALTKQSIEFEAERTKLENRIDELREKVEQLETQLAEEKLRMLGGSSRSMSLSSNVGVSGSGTGSEGMPPRSARLGGDGMLGDTTGMTILKSEFKKMMRETRADHMKLLRAEMEERRRLEAVIRKMKAEQALANRKGPSAASLGAK